MKIIIYFFLVFSIIFSFWFNIGGLAAINLILFTFALLRYKKFQYVKHSYLLLIPILTGFTSFWLYSVYDIFKDVFYLIIPFLLLSLGYLIGSELKLSSFLRLTIGFGSLYSCFYILSAFYHFGGSIFSDLLSIRDLVGAGNGVSVIAFGLATFLGRRFLGWNSITHILLIIVNLSAIILFSSRTYWIFTFIFILFHIDTGLSFRNKLLSLVVLCFLLFPLMYFGYNWVSGSNVPFIEKFENSLSEIQLGNYSDAADINTKYRGFESFRALETFLDGSVFNYLFGHGLGKMVDLKTEVRLGFTDDSYRRFIPILHNGYLYLLIKSGVAGLVCYLIFFFKLFKKVQMRFNSGKRYRFLFSSFKAAVLFLFFSNYVVYGFFNLESQMVYLFLGGIIFYLEVLKKGDDILQNSAIRLPY